MARQWGVKVNAKFEAKEKRKMESGGGKIKMKRAPSPLPMVWVDRGKRARSEEVTSAYKLRLDEMEVNVQQVLLAKFLVKENDISVVDGPDQPPKLL